MRCNVVMPGMIATPKVLGMPDSLQQALARTIPLGRFGEPNELAGVVSFLLSDAAAYLNGAVIRVEPGYGRSPLIACQSTRLKTSSSTRSSFEKSSRAERRAPGVFAGFFSVSEVSGTRATYGVRSAFAAKMPRNGRPKASNCER